VTYVITRTGERWPRGPPGALKSEGVKNCTAFLGNRLALLGVLVRSRFSLILVSFVLVNFGSRGVTAASLFPGWAIQIAVGQSELGTALSRKALWWDLRLASLLTHLIVAAWYAERLYRLLFCLTVCLPVYGEVTEIDELRRIGAVGWGEIWQLDRGDLPVRHRPDWWTLAQTISSGMSRSSAHLKIPQKTVRHSKNPFRSAFESKPYGHLPSRMSDVPSHMTDFVPKRPKWPADVRKLSGYSARTQSKRFQVGCHGPVTHLKIVKKCPIAENVASESFLVCVRVQTVRSCRHAWVILVKAVRLLTCEFRRQYLQFPSKRKWYFCDRGTMRPFVSVFTDALVCSFLYYLRQGGCVFVVVCLFACLLATLRKTFRTDLHEIFREGWQRTIEQTIKFWWRSGSWIRIQIRTRIRIATLVRRRYASFQWF